MPFPDSLQVQIGWEDSPAGIFVLDGSTLNSTDVLAGLGANPFTGTYDDVSDDVADGPRIVIGRDNALAQFQASSCTFTLQRPGSPDYYNPNAIAGQSPLAAVSPGFEPMRPVQVRATVDATTTVIWYGFIRSASWDSTTQATVISAEDLFLWLSRVRPTYTAGEISAAGVATVADAIGFILDGAGFTDPDLRDLGEAGKPGDTITFAAQTEPNKTALQIIAELLASDRGFFWVQGGVATYRARGYKPERDSIATVQSDMLRIGSGLDLDRIVNRQTVTREGGTAQVANDYGSQLRYGLADGQAITSAYLPDDTAAANLARYVLDSSSSPSPPITLTVDNDSATNLARQIEWQVLDRITAPVAFEAFVFGSGTFGGDAGFGGTQDYHVERIEQEWSVGGNHARSTYTLSRRGLEFARFGLMQFGADGGTDTSAVFAY